MIKPFKMSLHRVHDRVQITEGGEKLNLYVDSDPARMVAGLAQAQKMLQGLTNDSTEEEQRSAAEYFAQAIFGKDQAEQLMAFYLKDAGCVINVCGRYFNQRLGRLITKAQKKRAEK